MGVVGIWQYVDSDGWVEETNMAGKTIAIGYIYLSINIFTKNKKHYE